MKKQLLAVLISFTFIFISCDDDDSTIPNTDTQTTINNKANIIGGWILSDFESTTLETFETINEDGIRIVTSFSSEIIYPENNIYTETYSSNPNIRSVSGNLNIITTTTVSFPDNDDIDTLSSTSDEPIDYLFDGSTWDIENNTINFSLDETVETFSAEITELNETTLKISITSNISENEEDAETVTTIYTYTKNN